MSGTVLWSLEVGVEVLRMGHTLAAAAEELDPFAGEGNFLRNAMRKVGNLLRNATRSGWPLYVQYSGRSKGRALAEEFWFLNCGSPTLVYLIRAAHPITSR